MKVSAILLAIFILSTSTFCKCNSISFQNATQDSLGVSNILSQSGDSKNAVKTPTEQDKIRIQGNRPNLKENSEDDKINYQDIIGAIIGALLSGLVAILVFMLGRRSEKLKEINNIKKFGEELYEITRNITHNSTKQIENLTQFSDSIAKKPMAIGVYNKVSIHLLLRVKTFNPDKIYELFKILKFDRKDFIRYYNHIDFLEEIFRIIDEDYERIKKEIIVPFSNDYIKLKKQMLDLATDYIEDMRKKDKSEDPLSQYLNEYIMDYYSSLRDIKGHDLDHDNEVLIRPFLMELLKSFRDWPITSELIRKASAAANTAYTIKTKNLQMAEDVKIQKENVNDSIQEIKKLENKLEAIYAR